MNVHDLYILLIQNKTEINKKPRSLFAQQMSKMSANDLGLKVKGNEKQAHIKMEGKLMELKVSINLIENVIY